MKKSMLAVASGLAVGAFFAAPAMAQQAAPNNWLDYAGVGLAVAQVSNLSDGTALVVNAGKNINRFPGLSVEGEYTTTISKPDTSGADVSYWTLGAYGVYTLPVAQSFDVHARLGALFEHVDVSGSAGIGGDRDEGKVSGGVGGAYHLTPRLSITADYTRIEEDINHWGAGIRFNF